MVLGTQPGGCCRKRRGWAVPQPKHHVGRRCLGKPPGRCRPSARLSLLRTLQGLAGGSPSRQTSEFSASGMTSLLFNDVWIKRFQFLDFPLTISNKFYFPFRFFYLFDDKKKYICYCL